MRNEKGEVEVLFRVVWPSARSYSDLPFHVLVSGFELELFEGRLGLGERGGRAAGHLENLGAEHINHIGCLFIVLLLLLRLGQFRSPCLLC